MKSTKYKNTYQVFILKRYGEVFGKIFGVLFPILLSTGIIALLWNTVPPAITALVFIMLIIISLIIAINVINLFARYEIMYKMIEESLTKKIVDEIKTSYGSRGRMYPDDWRVENRIIIDALATIRRAGYFEWNFCHKMTDDFKTGNFRDYCVSTAAPGMMKYYLVLWKDGKEIYNDTYGPQYDAYVEGVEYGPDEAYTWFEVILHVLGQITYGVSPRLMGQWEDSPPYYQLRSGRILKDKNNDAYSIRVYI